MLLRRGIAGAPFFKALFTIGEQGRVVWKIKLEAIFGRGVIFAKVVVVATANSGPVFVDTTTPVWFEVAADCIKHHEPAILVLVGADTPV